MYTINKAFAAGILVFLMAGPAEPQSKELLQLQADVLNLKNQVVQLQTSLDQKTSVVQKLVEQVVDRMSTLADSVGQIAAVIDDVKTSNDQTAGELRILVGNLTNNLSQLTESMDSIRGQLNSLSNQVATMNTKTETLAGPDDLWKSANTDYIVGNYDLAIMGFKEFISSFPTDLRAPDAQIFLGESYLAQKKFDLAIVEFDLFLQKYPNHDKTKIALYKKGLAHADLNQTQYALSALGKVVTDYPNTIEATNAAEKMRELTGRRP